MPTSTKDLIALEERMLTLADKFATHAENRSLEYESTRQAGIAAAGLMNAVVNLRAQRLAEERDARIQHLAAKKDARTAQSPGGSK